ncbi:MAG: phosphoribosylamine--glycine ligase, partial [Paramuribaculum sp.]|nr:phosphoribosylamine--glycine ligase [Paramuribaculum sp.]
SKGYPGSYEKNKEISGLENVGSDTIAFHAGTKRLDDGSVVTSGGRVIAFSSLGNDIDSALKRSYDAISKVDFEGKTFRRDIGRDLGASNICE